VVVDEMIMLAWVAGPEWARAVATTSHSSSASTAAMSDARPLPARPRAARAALAAPRRPSFPARATIFLSEPNAPGRDGPAPVAGPLSFCFCRPP